MIVRLTADGRASLAEPEILDALKVEVWFAASGMQPGIWGSWDGDGRHVWLSANWLRTQGPADAAWVDRFDAMVRYAATKGWTDGHGNIRAHVACAA